MAKREVKRPDGDDAGPRPTMNQFKQRFEKILTREGADFTVDWFLNLVGQPNKIDGPRLIRTKTGSHWQWPYAERSIFLSRKFMKSAADFKKFIIAAREDGIFWRGDDPDEFYRIAGEIELFRTKDDSEYRQNAMTRMREFRKAITTN